MTSYIDVYINPNSVCKNPDGKTFETGFRTIREYTDHYRLNKQQE